MQSINNFPDDIMTLKQRIAQMEESIFNKNKIIELLTKKDETWQQIFDYNTKNNSVLAVRLDELLFLHLNYSDRFKN